MILFPTLAEQGLVLQCPCVACASRLVGPYLAPRLVWVLQVCSLLTLEQQMSQLALGQLSPFSINIIPPSACSVPIPQDNTYPASFPTHPHTHTHHLCSILDLSSKRSTLYLKILTLEL